MQSIVPRLNSTPVASLPPRPIVLELASCTSVEGYLQPLADGELWNAEPIHPAARRAARPSLRRTVTSTHWFDVYAGPGLVDGGLHAIRCQLGDQGDRRVEFEDGERFVVDAHGEHVQRSGEFAATSRTLERALGAPLVLALAVRGIHVLHASAVTVHPGSRTRLCAIAFAGDSGAGKSTLAAAARFHPDLGLTRIADDQLPVRLAAETAALPHFPQLKLGADGILPPEASTVLPLLQLVEIEHSDELTGVEIQSLGPAARCLALAKATVAAKLFDPELLARHFASCALASRGLEILRMRFPSGEGLLRAPLAALVSRLRPRD